MCPGCSHRGVFYTLNRLQFKCHGRHRLLHPGALPPLEAIDSCICMGASIGAALGMEKRSAASQKTVAVIGDSTFLHSGMAPLLDAVYNSAAITVLILDNGTTAMTGHQHHPGTGFTLQGEPAPAVDLEALCKGLGVRRVVTADPFDLKRFREIVKAELAAGEVSVIIARHHCALLNRTFKEPLQVDPESCSDCGSCLRLGCPALSRQDGKAAINEAICTGCELCRQLCRFEAIQPRTEKKEGAADA